MKNTSEGEVISKYIVLHVNKHINTRTHALA